MKFQRACFGVVVAACIGSACDPGARINDASVPDIVYSDASRAEVLPDVPASIDAPVADTAPVCPSADSDGSVPIGIATWVLPRNGPNSFQLPWPSDLTLTATGFADFAYVPNPTQNSLVSTYQSALANHVQGFSTIGATYFRFTQPVAPASLPAAIEDTLNPTSSVQIVDVDPASPDYGQRRPAQWYFRGAESHYWTPNTLAVAPAFGFPLRGNTHYAVVVTNRLRSCTGAGFSRDADLNSVLAASGGDAVVTHARAAHQSALDVLLAMAGVRADEILSLAVFTTQDPAGELFRAVDVAQTSSPPAVIDIARTYMSNEFSTFHGHYGPSPIFQTGALPYSTPGSGDIVSDSNGNPIIQTTTNITFTLSVPAGAPPTDGWPIVIYAHGTGGNSASFVGEGVARSLAAQGLAVFGFDQIFNGDRTVAPDGGVDPALADQQFFNFANPIAGRNNPRQGCIDLVQVNRLVQAMSISSDVANTDFDIHFDPHRVMFFGHSQGGLNGPLWLASDDTAGAAVLSGAGGTLAISLTQKTEPINIPNVIGLVLGIPGSQIASELVPLHPIITLAQTIIDVGDPVNYGRFIINEPRPGRRPHNIFQTQGFIDHYAPPDSIATVAMAIGVQLANPLIADPANYSLTGMSVGTLPLSLNVAHGTVTGVWQQFNSAPNSDGHFVVFNVPDAKMRAATFLGSWAHNPSGATVLQ